MCTISFPNISVGTSLNLSSTYRYAICINLVHPRKQISETRPAAEARAMTLQAVVARSLNLNSSESEITTNINMSEHVIFGCLGPAIYASRKNLAVCQPAFPELRSINSCLITDPNHLLISPLPGVPKRKRTPG